MIEANDLAIKAAEAQSLLDDEPAEAQTDVLGRIGREVPHEPDGDVTPAVSRRPAKKPTKSPVRPAPSKLSRFLPDAERVKIYKRHLGKRTYVRDYSIRDLSHARDIESFIQSYIVPTYGEGDYDVEAWSNDNKLMREMTLAVLDPNKKPAGVSPADATLGPVVDRLLGRIDQLEAGMNGDKRSPTDHVEASARLLAQIDALRKGGAEPPAAGADRVLDMMVAWQRQQAEAAAQASMARELAELRAGLRKLEQRPAPTPPPLPPVPSEPPIDIAAVIREATAASRPAFDLKELAALLRPASSPLAELATTATQLAPLVERLLGNRGDELAALREELRALKSQPARGIRDVIDEMSAVSQFVQKVRRGPEREDSFWSFLGNLVDQFPATVESLGGLVDRIRVGDEPVEPAPAASPAALAPRPVASRRPPLPAGLEPHIRAINDATDDAGRIGAVLTAFQKLGTSPPWRAYLGKAIALARTGQGTEALAFVRSFLDGLRDAELVTDETVAACVTAFEAHLDEVVAALRGTPSSSAGGAAGAGKATP